MLQAPLFKKVRIIKVSLRFKEKINIFNIKNKDIVQFEEIIKV